MRQLYISFDIAKSKYLPKKKSEKKSTLKSLHEIPRKDLPLIDFQDIPINRNIKTITIAYIPNKRYAKHFPLSQTAHVRIVKTTVVYTSRPREHSI
jgi:hypothetical protein